MYINPTRHATFHQFSDNSKHDSITTDIYSKHIIELLKEHNIYISDLSKIWFKKSGCDDQYRCDMEIYLLLVL